jgi:hypothetical protein
MTEPSVIGARAKTALPLPWQASLALGVCLGLVVSRFGASRVVFALLQTLCHFLNIPGAMRDNYQSDFFILIYFLYFAVVRKVGLGVFKQYFISGFLLGVPSFLVFGGLAIVSDVIAVPALTFYAFAVSRGSNSIKAAALGGLLGIAFAAAVFVLIVVNWVD